MDTRPADITKGVIGYFYISDDIILFKWKTNYAVRKILESAVRNLYVLVGSFKKEGRYKKPGIICFPARFYIKGVKETDCQAVNGYVFPGIKCKKIYYF